MCYYMLIIKTDLIICKGMKRFYNIPTVKVRISVYESHIIILWLFMSI